MSDVVHGVVFGRGEVLDTTPCIASYRSSNDSLWDPCGPSVGYTCSLHNSPDDDFEGACEFHANVLSQVRNDVAQKVWFP